MIVAALVPVGLGRYGVTGHTLWAVSSVIFLSLAWAVIILSLRRPEHRALIITQARTSPATALFFWVVLEVPIQVPLILVVLGVCQHLGSALYTTALVLNLFQAAFVLAQLVFSQAVPDSTAA